MRRATLKRGDRALERLTENPAMAVGNRVETLDGFRAHFDVELDIPPGAVPPGGSRAIGSLGASRAARATGAAGRAALAGSRLTKLAVSEIAFTCSLPKIGRRQRKKK